VGTTTFDGVWTTNRVTAPGEGFTDVSHSLPGSNCPPSVTSKSDSLIRGSSSPSNVFERKTPPATATSTTTTAVSRMIPTTSDWPRERPDTLPVTCRQ